MKAALILAVLTALSSATSSASTGSPISLPLFSPLDPSDRFHQEIKTIVSRRDSVNNTSVRRRDATPLFNTNGGFYTPVNIGTPGQTFNVLVDTGSSMMWVGSTSCGSCSPNSKKLDTSRSSSVSFPSGQSTQELYYAGGAVTGVLVNEQVSLGSNTGNSVPLVAVQSIDARMKNAMGSYGEGVIGLAFEGGMDQSQQHQNVVYHLASQGKLPNAVFGVWINPNTAIGSYDPNGGRLTLGGVDTSLYQGSFTFLSIIGSDGPSGYNYFWAVPAGSFSTPGFSVAAPSGFKTYFDTGSTIINIDSGTFQSLLGFLSSKNPSAFKSSGAYYTIDCGIGRSLPDITINLGGASFVLSSSDYIIPIPNNPVCALGIISSGADYWAFGQVFLRKYYSLHDLQNNRIGFALAANGNGNGVAPALGSPPPPVNVPLPPPPAPSPAPAPAPGPAPAPSQNPAPINNQPPSPVPQANNNAPGAGSVPTTTSSDNISPTEVPPTVPIQSPSTVVSGVGTNPFNQGTAATVTQTADETKTNATLTIMISSTSSAAAVPVVGAVVTSTTKSGAVGRVFCGFVAALVSLMLL